MIQGELHTSSNATTVYLFCGKTKKDHYANLNEKDVADNKSNSGGQLNHYFQIE